jgi:siroheme synthase
VVGLVQGDTTFACYMGSKRAASLSARLLATGLPPETPAIAVENATRPDERVIAGTLLDLPARLAAAELTGPTLILIARSCRLSPRNTLPSGTRPELPPPKAGEMQAFRALATAQWKTVVAAAL